jgi:hypothetical protein
VLGKKTQKHNIIASFLSIFDPYNIYPSPPGHATTKPRGKKKQLKKKIPIVFYNAASVIQYWIWRKK